MNKNQKLIDELVPILQESSTSYLRKHWKDEYFAIISDNFIWKLGFNHFLELHGIKILKLIPHELWMKDYILNFILNSLPTEEQDKLFKEYSLEFLEHPKLVRIIIKNNPLYLNYLNKDNLFKIKEIIISLLEKDMMK